MCTSTSPPSSFPSSPSFSSLVTFGFVLVCGRELFVGSGGRSLSLQRRKEKRRREECREEKARHETRKEEKIRTDEESQEQMIRQEERSGEESRGEERSGENGLGNQGSYRAWKAFVFYYLFLF